MRRATRFRGGECDSDEWLVLDLDCGLEFRPL